MEKTYKQPLITIKTFTEEYSYGDFLVNEMIWGNDGEISALVVEFTGRMVMQWDGKVFRNTHGNLIGFLKED